MKLHLLGQVATKSAFFTFQYKNKKNIQKINKKILIKIKKCLKKTKKHTK